MKRKSDRTGAPRLSMLMLISAVVLAMAAVGFILADSGDIPDSEGATSGKCGDDLTWTIDSEGNLKIEGSGPMYDYEYSSVRWGGNEVRSVVIGDSVTSVGYYAFGYYTSLTSVTIGNSVTSIESSAFSHCTSLASLTIGDSVASIGKYAFCYCRSLTSVTIPDSVKFIGKDAFSDCTSLTSLTFGDSLTSIGNFAFYNHVFYDTDGVTVLDKTASNLAGYTFKGDTVKKMIKQDSGQPMEHSVTYDIDGGTGSAPDGGQYVEGETFVLPTYDGAKDGYAFAGWRFGDTVYSAGGTVTMISGDMEFVAEWVLDNSCILTFDVTELKVVQGNKILLNGDKVDVGTTVFLTIYEVTGYTARIMVGDTEVPEGEYIVTDDVEFEVTYIPTKCIVAVDENVEVIHDGTSLPSGTSVDYGSKVMVLAVAKTGYTAKIMDGTTEIASGSEYTVTRDVEFEVTYIIETYTLTIVDDSAEVYSESGLLLRNGAIVTYGDVVIVEPIVPEGRKIVGVDIVGLTETDDGYTVIGDVTVGYEFSDLLYFDLRFTETDGAVYKLDGTQVSGTVKGVQEGTVLTVELEDGYTGTPVVRIGGVEVDLPYSVVEGGVVTVDVVGSAEIFVVAFDPAEVEVTAGGERIGSFARVVAGSEVVIAPVGGIDGTIYVNGKEYVGAFELAGDVMITFVEDGPTEYSTDVTVYVGAEEDGSLSVMLYAKDGNLIPAGTVAFTLDYSYQNSRGRWMTDSYTVTVEVEGGNPVVLVDAGTGFMDDSHYKDVISVSARFVSGDLKETSSTILYQPVVGTEVAAE